MNRQTRKLVIGGVLLVAIVVGLFASISSDNLTYYHTPTEIIADPAKFQGQPIRVMGLVEAGSVVWEPQATQLSFRITEDGKSFLNVNHVGAKPDMFKEGQGVVVEGSMTSETQFTATKLLVKHSEEYKVEKHQGKKDDYYKSLAN